MWSKGLTRNIRPVSCFLRKRVLPTWTREELTQQIFADSSLHRVLRQRIREALKHRGVSDIAPEHFMDQNSPMPGTVVIPALLARHRLSPEDVVCEFNKYTAGSPSKFQEGPQWVHNLFIACYLDLFASVVRACPLYSGFDTYCRMAKGNLRHFLELCHRAITTLSSEQDWALSARQQAEAARQVSASLLPEVRSFGRLGNDLHSFLLRLGTLFSLSQRRLSQSEPERTHFAIRDGEDSIDESSKRLLSEAVKWSVLFEERQTKAKSIGAPAVIDYVLNPIYAPYFHISYRKGRKLELSGQDFVILSSGTADEFKVRLYAKYRQAWDVPRDQLSRSLPLLALLDDEESQLMRIALQRSSAVSGLNLGNYAVMLCGDACRRSWQSRYRPLVQALGFQARTVLRQATNGAFHRRKTGGNRRTISPPWTRIRWRGRARDHYPRFRRDPALLQSTTRNHAFNRLPLCGTQNIPKSSKSASTR